MKIRLNHADARHIVCAWSVPGTKKYMTIDGCDDDDHGCSQPIIELLKANKMTNRAIFVVRKCGKKLNEKRIPAYVDAAAAVIKKFPKNTVTGELQSITEEIEKIRRYTNTWKGPESYADAVKPAYQSNTRRGYRPPRKYGAGRGRGGRGGRGGQGGSYQGGEKPTGKETEKRVYVPGSVEDEKEMLE